MVILILHMKKVFYILVFALLSVGSAMAQKSKSITDYFNDGIKAYRAAEYKEAIVNFNKVLELNPKFTEGLWQLGQCQVPSG